MFSKDDKIIGVFGCSVVSNIHNLSASLTQITRLGLLNWSSDFEKQKISSFSQNKNIYLSKRQIEIIHLLVKGKTAKGIAEALNLSRRTVEHHLENIKIQFGVSSKADLIEKIIDKYF